MNCKYFLSSLFIFSNFILSQGLTFRLNEGRFGDTILNYCKHKWISYKNNLALFVPNFKYKEALPLNTLEKSIHEIKNYKFSQQKFISKDLDISTKGSCLYIGDYYLQIDEKNKYEWPEHIFKLSIENAEFGAILKQMLTPQIRPDPILPQNIITVALHIRKGSGGDFPLSSRQYEDENTNSKKTKKSADHHHPLKFPPEQYYIDQLKFLHAYLDYQALYVYIFTDDKNPEKLLKRIASHLHEKNIIFNSLNMITNKNNDIMNDIYMMSKFDYLIRSGSHFPWVSQIIGNHKGIIYPKAWHWEDNMLKMDNVTLVIPDRQKNKIHEINI